jgi:hypothetical protein
MKVFQSLDWVIEIMRTFLTVGNSWTFNPAEYGARRELALLFSDLAVFLAWTRGVEIMRAFPTAGKGCTFNPAKNDARL